MYYNDRPVDLIVIAATFIHNDHYNQSIKQHVVREFETGKRSFNEAIKVYGLSAGAKPLGVGLGNMATKLVG